MGPKTSGSSGGDFAELINQLFEKCTETPEEEDTKKEAEVPGDKNAEDE